MKINALFVLLIKDFQGRMECVFVRKMSKRMRKETVLDALIGNNTKSVRDVPAFLIIIVTQRIKNAKLAEVLKMIQLAR